MKYLAIAAAASSLSAFAAGQAVVISGNAGFNASSPYNQLYNPRTVVTFKGRITGKQIDRPFPNMGNAVTLIVRATNGGSIVVDLGPEWYVANQVVRLKVGDNVQVTGSNVLVDGRKVMLAEMIV